MEHASTETPYEEMHSPKPPDGAALPEEKQIQGSEKPSEGDGKETTESTETTENLTENREISRNTETLEQEETSENMETSDTLETLENVETSEIVETSENLGKQKGLDIDDEEGSHIQDGHSTLEKIVKEDLESELAVTHTEVVLTVDLETERLTGMCRVCAKSTIPLFPVFGSENNLMEKIHSFLPILVTPDDLLPVKICARCISSLEQSQALVETCLAADKKLRDLLERKLTASSEFDLKTERDDVVDDYDDYSVGHDDLDRPLTPLSVDTSIPTEPVSPKREVITPEPTSPRARSKSAGILNARRSELERLEESDFLGSKELMEDSKTPNILRKRRTRQDNLSPTMLEKMRSYGIKESSVVMTKVDIPEDLNSAVVTTVSVPITKEKPKSRAGPKRLYRCLYCSETGSDAYKLLLHQMKMHPGNLLKCPHCGFVCGSDQKVKYDAHVLAHSVQGITQPVRKIPELVTIAPRPSGVSGPIPSPANVQQLINPSQSGGKKSWNQPKSLMKSKSLLKDSNCSANRVPILPKKRGKVEVATPVFTQIPQIPGNAIMLRIRVDGQGGADGSAPAPAAIVPVTLYQCARCRLNFNSKEGVEKHLCVIPPNLIPVRPFKPGDPIPIAPKPGELIPIMAKPVELIPIAPKPGDVNFPCTTCGTIFTDPALLREHIETHYKMFKCDKCENSFRSEFQLRQHAKKHDPPEKMEFRCPLCPKVYTVKSRLRVHVHSHSDTPRCICPQCGKVFRTDGGYRNHLKAHENKRAFACSVCGLRFNRRGNMKRHEQNCDGKKTLTCKYCSETFDQKDELIIHRSSVHPELEFSTPIPDAATGNKEKRYACKVCSEGFVRVMDLRKHQLIHSEEELNAVKDVPDGGAYLCHTCGKQLHHKHNYKLHMMHHQGKALFKCDQCDRTFTSKFSLNYHHMLHTGDFPFKCTVCNESFRTSVALQVHRYKHTGDKPYRCKSCEMGFFTRHSLRLHQIVHSTERNYVCRVCGSTFKRRKTLRYHSLIHTGEKPHTCRICGKSFRQKGTCTIHERNHELPAKRPKPNPHTGRRPKVPRQEEEIEEEELEEIEGVVLEEADEGDIEDERAAQMVELEEEEQVELEVEEQVELEVEEQVELEVEEQVELEVGEQVEMEVEEQVEMEVGEQVEMEEQIEAEIEEHVETEIAEETIVPESQPRVWRIPDSKVQFRLKNVDWKRAATSQVNEAVYVLREASGMKEGLPEVCTVQSEVIGGEFLSMYPDIQIHDAEIVEGEKASIEFTTADGTIRILR